MAENENTAAEKKPAAQQKEQPVIYSPDGKPAEGAKRPWYKRPLLAGIAIAVIIALVVIGVLWWLHSRHYEFTDDAAIDIQSERVSARVPGQALRVLVQDNQDVEAGQILVEIDPADYQAKLDQATAERDEAVARVEQQRSQLAIAEAEKEQARAEVAAAEAAAVRDANDARRFEDLHKSLPGAVSRQQLDASSAAAVASAAQRRAADRKTSAAEAQIEMAKSQVRSAESAVPAADAVVTSARLALSYCQVRASRAGRVAQKSVSEGNAVQPGIELMAIVPRDVFVTANFKETQLRTMRPGQPVSITVDAYPDLELSGHVDSIQPASGQAFSVLPAENATGNWVKIVQRVPVKILLDRYSADPAQRLGPGMSVETTVTVR